MLESCSYYLSLLGGSSRICVCLYVQYVWACAVLDEGYCSIVLTNILETCGRTAGRYVFITDLAYVYVSGKVGGKHRLYLKYCIHYVYVVISCVE